MAVLPEDYGLAIEDTLLTSQPSLTWYVDQESKRIQGTADGEVAVRQAVEIILNVERFRWQIYRPSSGVQLQELVGHDPAYVASELRRRVEEALLMDDRIIGISKFTYSVSGDILTADITVDTVYGQQEFKVEVTTA